MPGFLSLIKNIFHSGKNDGPEEETETVEEKPVDDGTSHQVPSHKRFVCNNKSRGCWCGKKMEERHVLSPVNKQLLEAAFLGTLSELVQKSPEIATSSSNPLNLESKGDTAEKDQDETNQKSWSDVQLRQLEKAVKTTGSKKKLQIPGFHAIQALRKARESGWSVKKEGPPNAEKYGANFWGEVAKCVTSPEKHGIKRSPDECIDAYVGQHDPCISGTVLEKLLAAQADPNAVDRVADINGNTPLHFFAIAAAEEGASKGEAKKDEKGTARQKEERNRAKRNADAIDALASNKKCLNCNGERAQDAVKAVLDKLDKHEKQKAQDLKAGAPHPFLGMVLSSARVEAPDASLKQTKKQLEKLKKLL